MTRKIYTSERERRAANYQKRLKENPDKIHALNNIYAKRWRDKNREKMRATNRERDKRMRIEHPAQVRAADKAMREKLGQWHGLRARLIDKKITLDQFHAAAESQDFRCAICEKDFLSLGDHNVDHDHATHRFRGLLCTSCNCGLGFFKDDSTLLSRAVNYLSGIAAIVRSVQELDATMKNPLH